MRSTHSHAKPAKHQKSRDHAHPSASKHTPKHPNSKHPNSKHPSSKHPGKPAKHAHSAQHAAPHTAKPHHAPRHADQHTTSRHTPSSHAQPHHTKPHHTKPHHPKPHAPAQAATAHTAPAHASTSHTPELAPTAPATHAVTFAELNLAQPILHALEDENYKIPTPIQAQAIPPIMQGRDVLGCAQTGTGKTAAFALPILHRLLSAPPDTTRRGPALPRALILSPTRELATQIGDSFATYGGHAGLTHAVIFGGVSQYHQVRALHRGVDILVATPGRLIDLMDQRLTNFSAMQILVLDEADRMLDMGFINPIRKIAAALPKPRQTLLFSATMPKEIRHLADSLLHDPVRVAVAPVASTVDLIEQRLYLVSRTLKGSLLEHLLNEHQIDRAVVFTRTKHGADKVARRLNAAGITATAIHGNKAQNQRERALAGFRTGRSRVLVATDVAARGLDVDAITHVFNFDLPNEPEAYVHRIGRTGRAGATGIAISFCDHDERPYLRDIERLTAKRLTALDLPELPEPPPSHHSHSTHSHSSHGHATSRDSDRRRDTHRESTHHTTQDRAQEPASHAKRPHGLFSPRGRQRRR